MRSAIGNIPDTMLAEILKRLSLKSLLICRCVQKSWYHFLQTPDFINLQFIYQQFNSLVNPPPPKYLLFKDIFENNVLSVRYDDDQCQELKLNLEIPPVLLAKHAKLNILTSFGLMCLYCDSTSFPRCMKYGLFDIYLWNPFVQKYKTLPDVPFIPPKLFSCRIYMRCLAFGYVPQINDYRVVTIVSYDDVIDDDGEQLRSYFICAYSLTTNSWKTTTATYAHHFQHIDSLFQPVILNGVAFWYVISEDFPMLLYYDTINDIHYGILLPHEVCRYPSLLSYARTHRFMRQFGQSIVCTMKRGTEPHAHTWELKEGSEEEEYFWWEKKICVNLHKKTRLEFIGSRNNGELILGKLYQCSLVSYNVEKDEVHDFVQSWYTWFSHGIARGKDNYDFEDRKLDIQTVPFTVEPFMESLFLLDADENHHRRL